MNYTRETHTMDLYNIIIIIVVLTMSDDDYLTH